MDNSTQVINFLEEQVKDLVEQLSNCGEEILRLQSYIKELEEESFLHTSNIYSSDSWISRDILYDY